MTDDHPDRFSVDFTGLTLLGVYRVEKKIADGGMGSIYLAQDTNLGRPVVVKVPHPRFLGEPGFRSRFSQEVEELIRLEHPHVARILARGEHEQVPFFILQYLGGGSLEDRMEPPSDPKDVLTWFSNVATTLDFVHGGGLVHRDVKPANILFDEAGNVFLSDFGVAKVVGSDSAITGTGVGVGSPKYMAPEQAVSGEVGPAADQYALAATVYEALAGRPPFEGGNPIEILMKKGREDPEPLAAHVPALPAGSADAVMRALKADPGERFASCGAFLEAFRAGLQPEPTPVRHAIHWPVIALGSVLVATVLYFLIGHGSGGGEASPEDRVILLDAGAEPRAVLRLAPKPGQRQHLAIVMDMSSTIEKADGETDSQFPASDRMEAVFTVTSVDGNGDVSFTWELPGGIGGLPGTAGATARGVLSDRGLLESLTFEGSEELDETTRLVLTKISAGVRQLPVPLPAEPVGIGARWEVTDSLEMIGLRMVQTGTFELVRFEGDQMEIHMAAAVTAAPQETASFGPGVRMKLRTYLASGEGNASQKLDRLMPDRSKSSLDLNMTGEFVREGASTPMKLHFHLETHVEPWQ